MSDPQRLRDSASEADRALLREAARADLPSGMESRIRQAVEGRISPAGRRRARWRLALAGAGTLIAGSALAFGVVELRDRLATPDELPPHQAPPIPAAPALPAMEAPPALPPPRPPAGAPARTSPPRRRWPSLGGPALTEPPGGEEPRTARVPPVVPSGRLVIAHQGRQAVSILLHGTRLTGEVRGQPVDLELRGQRVLGKAADEPLSLVLQESEGRGSIAGHEVGFELSRTREGAVLRGNLPGQSARLEIGDRRLSWFPGCDAPLIESPAGSGHYRGQCHGGQVEVTIPAAWKQLPELSRLFLLALFLVEREPGLPDYPRTLFGPPDWPPAR